MPDAPDHPEHCRLLLLSCRHCRVDHEALIDDRDASLRRAPCPHCGRPNAWAGYLFPAASLPPLDDERRRMVLLAVLAGAGGLLVAATVLWDGFSAGTNDGVRDGRVLLGLVAVALSASGLLFGVEVAIRHHQRRIRATALALGVFCGLITAGMARWVCLRADLRWQDAVFFCVGVWLTHALRLFFMKAPAHR